MTIKPQTVDSSKGANEQINLQAPFYSNELPLESPRISKEYDSTKIEKYEPFIIYKGGSYMIAAKRKSDTTQTFSSCINIWECKRNRFICNE